MKFLKEYFDADSISPHLMITAYDDRKKLYFSDRDESAAFMLELTPASFGTSQYYSVLSAFLNAEWPRDTIIQFFLYADPNIDPVLIRYRQLREHFRARRKPDDAENMMHQWALGYADYLERRKFSGIDPDAVPIPFRNFRAFICARIPCTMNQLATTSAGLERLQENRDMIISGLDTCNVRSWNLEPKQCVAWLYQLWNPNHPQPYCYNSALEAYRGLDRSFMSWSRDSQKTLNEHIIAPDTSITRTPDYLRVDSWKVMVATLFELPEKASPLDINQLIGDTGVAANRRQIGCPFLLTLTVSMNSENMQVQGKGNWVMAQNTPIAALAPRMKKKKEELIKANEIITNQGKLIAGIMTCCFFHRNSKYLKSVVSATAALWRQHGYVLAPEKFQSLPLFMMSQPMQCCPTDFKKSRRSFSAPTGSFSYVAPLQADSNRGGNAMNIFLTRRGQVIGFDLRDSPRDYNATVVAPPGSGKSFLLNSLIQNNISTGGRNFTIEPGRSYRKLCQAFNGQYIDLSPDSDVSFNVFSLITPKIWLYGETVDDINIKDIRFETCMTVLSQMISPGEVINKDNRSLVENLTREIFDELSRDWLKKQYLLRELWPVSSRLLGLLTQDSSKTRLDDLSRELWSRIEPASDSEASQPDHLSVGVEDQDVDGIHATTQPAELLSAYGGLLDQLLDSNLRVDDYARVVQGIVSELRELTDADILTELKKYGDEKFVRQTEKIFSHCQEENCFTIDLLITRLDILQRDYISKGILKYEPESMIQRLKPYSSSGRFGKWFTGMFNVEFENSLTSLDLEQLRRFPDLYEIIVVLILSSIEYNIYIKQDKSRTTYIIIDEAAQLMAAKNVGKFIEDAYRRFRKYGACIITIVQSAMDLYEKNPDISSAILTSAYKFILNPKESDIDRAIEKNVLSLTPHDKEQVCSITTVPPHYSEIAIQDPYEIWWITRLHVDRKTSLIYTTEPLETELIERVQREFYMDIWQAVSIVYKYIEKLDKKRNVDEVFQEIRVDIEENLLESV